MSKNGWCVTLVSDGDQAINNDRENACFLSWSPYDRVSITKATEFEKFIFPEPNAVLNWCGVKQQLHIVPVDSFGVKINENVSKALNYDDDEWEIEPKTGEKYLIKSKSHDTYAFYCLVTVRFADEIIEYISNMNDSFKAQKIREKICGNIMMHLRVHPTDADAEYDCISFESLGSEDFAFIILSNDLKTFVGLLEIIRNEVYTEKNDGCSYDLFKSICTFTGFNNPKYNGKPSLEALVKINVKKSDGICNIKEEISRKIKAGKISDFYVLFQGKGLVEIKLSPTDYTLWSEKGILNGDSSFYKDNILSSRTYWIERNISINDEECKERNANKYVINGGLLNDDDIIKIKNQLRERREKRKNNQSDDKLENKVGEFIYNEYNRLSCLTRCTEWMEVLEEQKNSFITIASFYEKSSNISSYKSSQDKLIEEMQAVLTHINQACTPVSEIPYHNHYYSGSFSEILKMYYGIIASIIKIGYDLPRKKENQQSALSFGIKFETTNRPHTTMYSLPNHERRIAIFHLPYYALYDFKKTLVLLIHEVFHYIAPIDRTFRNRAILKVWIAYIADNFEKCAIEKFKDKSEYDLLDNILSSNFSKLFDQCCDDLKIQVQELYTIESSDFIKFEYNFIYIIFDHIVNNIVRLIHDEIQKMELKKGLSLDLKSKIKDISEVVHEMLKSGTYSDNGYYFDEWFLMSTNGLERMGEYAFAIKEAFCDLFMCKILKIDFEDYLSIFFDLGSDILRKNIDEKSLIYRINLVGISVCGQYPDWRKINSNRVIRKADDNDELVGIFETIKSESFNLKTDEITWVFLRDSLSKELDFFEYANEYSGRDVCLLDYIELCNKLRSTYNDLEDDASKFDMHMKSIHKFGNIVLPAMNKDNRCDDFGEGRTTYSTNINPGNIHLVYSVENYIQEICGLAISEYGRNDDWWYRGVCNDRYPLLPSLFRNLDEKLSLYANQVNILKLAYSSTMQFPDMWKGSIPEHMCCLQHYGLPTNLLDFSTNMLAALHFALNPDVESDLEALDRGEITPVVYAFNPNEYSRAITVLTEELIVDDISSNVSPVLYDVAQDNLEGFFPKQTDAYALIEHTKKYNIPYVPSRRTDDFPVPIVIRRSNARVLSQNGTFIAFSLNSRPKVGCGAQEQYSYLDLRKIQCDYSNFLKRNGVQERRFLHEIHIQTPSAGRIRQQLNALNVSKAQMYPELKNIFDEAKALYLKRAKK